MLATGKWFTAAEVANQLNGEVAASNPSQFASKLRRQGRLLGVRHRGEYLHPDFQFSPKTGVLIEEVAALLGILPKDPTGWGPALWCFQPTKWLGERSPAAVFRSNPASVIAAAKKEFKPGDGGW